MEVTVPVFSNMCLGSSLRYVVWQLTLLTLTTSCQGDVSKYAPKPGDFKRLDSPTNKTIDQLLTQALGGIDVASNKILAPGSYILAELDMYLSQEQFLTLYEPPSSNFMISSSDNPPPDSPPSYPARNKRRSIVDVIARSSLKVPTNDAFPTKKQTVSKDSNKDVSISDVIPPQLYERKDNNKDVSFSDVIPPQRYKRKAMRDVILRWPAAEVPYHLAFGDFTDTEEYLIKQAMTEWERYTCVTFRPAVSNDVNLVRFQNGEGCISQLGMVGGVQVLILDKEGCRFKGLYLHEIGHALGLVHEHQLPDRDDYIEIMMHNVAPHFRVFFSKYSPQVINQYDVPYEYSSIMHYGVTAFSHDGQSQTIKAKDPSKEESIGKVFLKELSFSDVKVVNQMYGCAASCPGLVTCTGQGFLDQNCRCVCPDGSDSCQVSNVHTESSGSKNRHWDASSSANETCENLYENWKCSVWANQGECDRNPTYMKKHCKRSCGLCDKQNNEEESKNHFTTWAWQWFGMFTNLFPTDWMIGVCKDVHTFTKCNKWKEQGDCVTNAFWMENNCKLTCNFCGNPAFRAETNCRNHHNDAKCDKWALEGECVLNDRWMRDHCQRSCRACADVLNREPEGGGKKDDKEECVDEHDSKECKVWAKAGECYVNPTWMIANCRKSCDKCNDGSCKDLYDDVQCEVWAQEMECMKNRVWMHNNCMKACGLCRTNTTDADEDVTSGSGRNETGKDKKGNEDRSGKGTNGGSGDSDPTGSGKDRTTETPRPTPRPTLVTPARRPPVTPSTQQPDTASCYNAHNSLECQNWASSGHCDINPSWMHVSCRKACGQCDSDTSARKQDERCEDRTKGCDGWAKTGFCVTNAGYNLIYCKKSCSNCNGCRDEQFLCALWAKSGHCQTNARYMLRQCQKSCNTCNY